MGSSYLQPMTTRKLSLKSYQPFKKSKKSIFFSKRELRYTYGPFMGRLWAIQLRRPPTLKTTLSGGKRLNSVFHDRGTCFKICSDSYSVVDDFWTLSLQSEKLPVSMRELETGT